MARDFTWRLLVLLLISTSTTADSSFVDAQDDPNYFINLSDDGEDETFPDFSQIDERLSQHEDDSYQQMWLGDEKAVDQEIRTEDMDFKAYNEDAAGSQRKLLQKSRNSRGDVANDAFGRMKRGKREKCDGEPGVLKPDCKGALKRNHFESLRSQREDPNINSDKRALTPDNKGALKRSHFELRISANDGQLKTNHFEGLRGSRPYKERYGDIGTLQTDGSQAHRNLRRIQGSNLYDIENDQREGRESDGEQVEANDYNSDEQLMRTKYTDGLVIRQIYDDQSQYLQPELDESPPYLDSDPPSDFDGDNWIPKEKIFEVHSNAEEASSGELLALLVKLVREKRQKESPET